MKKLFRRIAAFMILAPGLIWTYFLLFFIGKERAIKLCGPFFTLASKPFARNWVSKIESASDFDNFSIKMRKDFWLWGPLFDFSIVQDDHNTFKLNITYCPICDVIKAVGLSGLAPFVCEADWQVANENKDKWLFKREYQLSTGDPYCDHTYLRKTQNT
ncbi:MAG: hypothetical protein C0390_01040 [Syntrophus sp. (in: bacteria)]|nr:hypothetical protein [Syntrophus sp. (in: bacteria)]